MPAVPAAKLRNKNCWCRTWETIFSR